MMSLNTKGNLKAAVTSLEKERKNGKAPGGRLPKKFREQEAPFADKSSESYKHNANSLCNEGVSETLHIRSVVVALQVRFQLLPRTRKCGRQTVPQRVEKTASKFEPPREPLEEAEMAYEITY